jgi:hypothetical protein
MVLRSVKLSGLEQQRSATNPANGGAQHYLTQTMLSALCCCAVVHLISLFTASLPLLPYAPPLSRSLLLFSHSRSAPSGGFALASGMGLIWLRADLLSVLQDVESQLLPVQSTLQSKIGRLERRVDDLEAALAAQNSSKAPPAPAAKK